MPQPLESPAREVSAIQLPALPPRRNRHVLTLLSSLWPGLGQAVAGARRTALLLALPPLVLVALGVAALVSPDRLSRLALLLDPAVIGAVLLLEIAVLLWRIGAAADAFRRGEGSIGGRASVLTAIGLLFVIVPSVYAAYLTEVAREAATQVFSAVETNPGWHPSRTPPPDPEFTYTGTPEPTAPDLGRFTVLFLGADSGPGRSEFLTDTMIVASLDPVSGAVSMVSMPRDTVDVPLTDGRVFHGKINSLVSYVRGHPGQFPDAPSGETVLAGALGQLLGVQVNGWVEVNLPGFVSVVDSLHGIDVTVHDGFCDPTYHDYGYPDGFAVSAGRYHFTGDEALAYARVRKASGESDFTRAARQQEVIVALRDRVVSGGFLGDPAGFIASFGNLIKTNLDPSTLMPYVEPASGITRDHIFRAVITYPLIHFLPGDPRGWVVAPRLDRIRALGAQAFPFAGTLPTGLDTIPLDDGTKVGHAPSGCTPLPKPTPQPTPTPLPTAGVTPEPTAEPTPTTEPAPTDTPPPTP
ncbi:MAG TPA: LCP family protein [Candidatus Acidoferrales bacterium]|nr:LCP family protein [Candidatus Acidoferrales bacterium]